MNNSNPLFRGGVHKRFPGSIFLPEIASKSLSHIWPETKRFKSINLPASVYTYHLTSVLLTFSGLRKFLWSLGSHCVGTDPQIFTKAPRRVTTQGPCLIQLNIKQMPRQERLYSVIAAVGPIVKKWKH